MQCTARQTPPVRVLTPLLSAADPHELSHQRFARLIREQQHPFLCLILVFFSFIHVFSTAVGEFVTPSGGSPGSTPISGPGCV